MKFCKSKTSFAILILTYLLLLVPAGFSGGQAFAGGQEDYDRGVAAWEQERYDETIEAITKALESGELDEDQLVAAYYLMGDTLWEIDRDEEAIEYLTKAIDTQGLADFYLGYSYYQRGFSLWKLDHDDEALSDMSQAVALRENPSGALYYRALIASSLEKFDITMKDIVRLANEYPDMLNNVRIYHIWNVVRWAKEEGRKDELLVFLSAIRSAKYTGPKIEYSTEGLMQELALLHLEKGEVNKALILIYGINSTSIILETLIDNRYQLLWDKFVYKSHSSLEELLEKETRENKRKMEKSPQNPVLVRRYAESLRKAGRSDEAIDILKDAINNFDKFETEEDGEDILWLQNALAYAYQDIGKNKKSFKTFEKIIETTLEENGSVVNQYINYSISLMEAGKFEQALERIAATGFDYSSDYGDMFLLMGRACSLHETGKKEEAAKIGDEIFDRWEDNSGAAQITLLCLEDYERAADLVIMRLSDEFERENLLVAIQHYKPGKDKLSYRAELFKRYQRVLDDPRVLSEIQKYGRILDLPMTKTYWGDF